VSGTPLVRYVPKCAQCGRGATSFVHHSDFNGVRHISNDPKCSVVKLHCQECCANS